MQLSVFPGPLSRSIVHLVYHSLIADQCPSAPSLSVISYISASPAVSRALSLILDFNLSLAMSSSQCAECKIEAKHAQKLTACFNGCGAFAHKACVKATSQNPEPYICSKCSRSRQAVPSKDALNSSKLTAILSENIELRLYLKTLLQMNSDLVIRVENLSKTVIQMSERLEKIESSVNESADQVGHISRSPRAGSKRRCINGRRRSTSSSSVSYRNHLRRSSSTQANQDQVEASAFIRGTRGATSGLKTVKSLSDYKKVFLTGLHPSTTAEDMFKYVNTEMQVTPNRVLRLNSRHPSPSIISFCVVVDDPDFDKCLDAANWPGDVNLKPFDGNVGWRLIKESFPPQAATSVRPSPSGTRLPSGSSADSAQVGVTGAAMTT